MKYFVLKFAISGKRGINNRNEYSKTDIYMHNMSFAVWNKRYGTGG